MKSTALFILFFVNAICSAQTRLIAHKSHSGSNKSFSKAYQQNLFDINHSNFGLPENRNFVLIDTIIAINDQMTVIKLRESNVCYPFHTRYTDLKKSDFKSKSDTLINHQVFKRNNSEKYIKKLGHHQYHFDNPMDSVVFIGFKE